MKMRNIHGILPLLLTLLVASVSASAAYYPDVVFINGEKMRICCNWAGPCQDSIYEKIDRDYHFAGLFDAVPYTAYLSVSPEQEIILDSLFIMTKSGDQTLHHNELIRYYGEFDDGGRIKASWLKNAHIEICKGKRLESYIDGECYYEQHIFCTVDDGVIVNTDSVINNKQLSHGLTPGCMPLEFFYKEFAKNFPCDKYIRKKRLRSVDADFKDVTYSNGHVSSCTVTLFMERERKNREAFEDKELTEHILTAIKGVPFATYLINGQVRLRWRYGCPGIDFQRFFTWYKENKNKKEK